MLTPATRFSTILTLLGLALPCALPAQDGSPYQAEYLAPPVPAGPRVDEFSGDFTYGIPVMTVPDAYGDGYTVMLSYRAGSSTDQVSWVGYGWSINPGAIIRNKRGFPDDWSGNEVYLNKRPANYTISATSEAGLEFASVDGLERRSYGGSATKQYSNLTGFARIWGLTAGASYLGNFAGLSYTNDNGVEDPQVILSPNLFTTLAHVTEINPKPNSFLASIGTRTLNRALAHGGSRIHLGPMELTLGPPVTHPINGESINFGSKLTVSASAAVVVGVDYGTSGNVTATWNNVADTLPAHGYLNSHRALDDPESIMDMTYERDLPYSYGDPLLPMPVSNADQFSVVGGGSFRAYNRGIASYRPNAMTSEIEVENIETTNIVTAWPLLGWGVGARWGNGSITYQAGEWRDVSDTLNDDQRFSDRGDHDYFFRMSGDMGGELWYDQTADARRAGITLSAATVAAMQEGFLLGADLEVFPQLDAALGIQSPPWKQPGRSVHVGYTLNREMLRTKGSVPFASYNRDAAARSLVGDRDLMPEGIGEFALYGGDGSRLVYGLPMYARNERYVQLGLPNYRRDSATRVLNNAIAYSHTDVRTSTTAVGSEHPDPYATAWLITCRTDANYVDRTGDGPTDDDLGGWVLFRYSRGAGTDLKTVTNPSGWEYWRSPRSGLRFSPGNLSDPDDDLGSYSDGRKELYYLDRIETHTHVALFVLSDSARKDSYAVEPLASESDLAGDSSSAMPAWAWNNYRRTLDRIELYTKGADGEPDSLLNTVRFEYDYSLRKNSHSSQPIVYADTTRHGLLTLRKVWAEPQGTRPARITPYVFGYEYRTADDYSEAIRSRYPDITSFASGLSATSQNPDFSLFDQDSWGYYQRNDAERQARLAPWVSQRADALFDPAAWQMKWIRQPGGSEVQVQYEQDDYAYVHDRPALAMVSLYPAISPESSHEGFDGEIDNRYFLRLSDLGVDSTDRSAVARIHAHIKQHADGYGKLFYRFLYALTGDTARLSTPERSSEYIEGYARLASIGIDSVVESGQPTWYAVKLTLRSFGLFDISTPWISCQELVRRRMRGRLDNAVEIPFQGTNNARSMVQRLASTTMPPYDEDNHCKCIDYSNSYIRIPVLHPKRGGGLRVRRLLVHDPGVERDSALYGTEYLYETTDPVRGHISSGVASNEPAASRAENALVGYMRRYDVAKVKDKVAAGVKRAKSEGPLGESLLPGASVGYSRVITRPIHQGATTTDFNVNEFYTYRDFPFDGTYAGIGPAIEETGIDEDTYRTPFFAQNFLVYQQNESIVRATQGYRVVKTDMHGKVRRTMSCGGRYDGVDSNWMVGASTEYAYFAPGDSLPLLCAAGDSVRYGYPGREMEIVHASRHNGAYIDDFKIEGDIGFWFLSAFAYVATNTSELKTHVTTKVVSYPALLRGVLTYADGNYAYSENVAFDPHTGAPTLTRSFDEFNGQHVTQGATPHVGTYHSMSIPAHRHYPELGRKADNEGLLMESTTSMPIYKGVTSNIAYLDFPDSARFTWMSNLGPGDLLELTRADTTGEIGDAGVYHVDSASGHRIWLIASQVVPTNTAVERARTGNVDVHVVRSGRVNALGAAAGSVATYGVEPGVALQAAAGTYTGSYTKRLQIVDLLNTAFASQGGTIRDSMVSSSLKIASASVACGDFGTNDSIVVSTTYPGGHAVYVRFRGATDTVWAGLDGGRFALNASGQVVFGPVGTVYGDQLLQSFRLCGDTVRTSFDGVIAASSTTFGDNAIQAPTNGNVFESGTRGRWSPRTTHTYRTTTKPGSNDDAGKRSYFDAGVFDDFSSFQWRHDTLLDRARWLRMDSIVTLDRHNRVLEVRDNLGHATTTAFGYGESDDAIPIYTTWNSRQGTSMFVDFERSVGGFQLVVYDSTRAHTGRRSVRPSTLSGNFLTLKADSAVRASGLVVRFWLSPDTPVVKIKYKMNNQTTVTAAHHVARVGEWGLYEVVLSSSQLTSLYSLNESMSLGLIPLSSSDTVFIDDIGLFAATAVLTAGVHDTKTLRRTATFDEAGFSSSPVYDGRGVPFAAVIENAAGNATVLESYRHVPGVERTYDGEPMSVASVGWQPDSYSTFDGGGTIPETATAGGEFDLFNIELGERGISTTILGKTPSELRTIIEDALTRLNGAGIVDIDALDRLEQLYAAERAAADLLADETAIDSASRGTQAARRRLDELRKERRRLLERLGVDDHDIERWTSDAP